MIEHDGLDYQVEIEMNAIVPKDIKVYKTLANCCKYQHVLPCGVEPIWDNTGKFVGWAAGLNKYKFWILP